MKSTFISLNGIAKESGFDRRSIQRFIEEERGPRMFHLGRRAFALRKEAEEWMKGFKKKKGGSMKGVPKGARPKDGTARSAWERGKKEAK